MTAVRMKAALLFVLLVAVVQSESNTTIKEQPPTNTLDHQLVGK